MKDVMGVIFTSKDDYNMRELTSSRAVSALPVVGRYRIIDFQLSSSSIPACATWASSCRKTIYS
jgi:ADP-glucose pyrophosphorylase